MLALALPLLVYFVFAVGLCWLSAWARDAWYARKNRAWRK